MSATSNVEDAQETSPETATAESLVIAGCKSGDEGSRRRLYESSHQNVFRLMVRMVGSADAPDLTQQVFLHVFEHINQFAGRSRLSTWIYRVAVNEALQHLRRKKQSRVATLEKEPMDQSRSTMDDSDEKELLEQALSKVDPDLRSTFLLREVEGLSYIEIAQALGIPQGTVGSRLNRARLELKQHLIDLGWEP